MNEGKNRTCDTNNCKDRPWDKSAQPRAGNRLPLRPSPLLYTHDLVHVVRSKDACRILGISYSHLQHCIARGYLDKVFGAGKLGIGVTAESITRFTTLRTRRTSEKERTK